MFKKISMMDLHTRRNAFTPREIILDVRSPEEYAEGHIPGSRNIPYDEVDRHVEELKKLDHIYIHCRSGKRAQIASQTLQNLGLTNLVCIAGSGMDDWVSAGFDVEKS